PSSLLKLAQPLTKQLVHHLSLALLKVLSPQDLNLAGAHSTGASTLPMRMAPQSWQPWTASSSTPVLHLDSATGSASSTKTEPSRFTDTWKLFMFPLARLFTLATRLLSWATLASPPDSTCTLRSTQTATPQLTQYHGSKSAAYRYLNSLNSINFRDRVPTSICC